MSTAEQRFIWLDLETTGLDPEHGEILELAMFATDAQGLPIKAQFQRVFTFPRREIIGLMDDYVLSMHLGSGLLKEVWSKGDDTGRWEEVNRRAWNAAHEWLIVTSAGPKNTFLAGNSIHFDRAWLTRHAPKMLTLVSHRMLDVSSFLLARPDLRSGEAPAHRALDDARQSADTYFIKFRGLLNPDTPINPDTHGAAARSASL